jgi:hypothetical protein
MFFVTSFLLKSLEERPGALTNEPTAIGIRF